MKKLTSLLVPLALAISSAALVAQSADTCPHKDVERVPPGFWDANQVECGSGVQVNIGGVGYVSPPGRCTLLVVYTPEHWIPVSRANSNTYVEPAGLVRQHIFRYRCKTVYLLGLIPIDGECRELAPMTGDEIPTYVVRRCED